MKSFIKFFAALLVAVVMLSVAGCASVLNKTIEEDNLPKIVIGTTTKTWVQENIGTPQEIVNLKKEGVQLWKYSEIEGQGYLALVKTTFGASGEMAKERTLVITFKGDVVTGYISNFGGKKGAPVADTASGLPMAQTR